MAPATSTTAATRSPGGITSPAGITLLEVLISCGLLIMGLSTVAAMLPAAGTRLTQASTEDRAAVLLSNATAEIFNRGLVAAVAFPTSGTTATTAGRMLAIGKVLGLLPTYGTLPSGRPTSDYFAAPSTEGATRCGSQRTFVLEDVLAYGPSRSSDTPVNAFTRDAAGVGPRTVREGICWGATLTPATLPATAGGKAVLSIAIFKREGESPDGRLEEGLPLVLTRVGSCYEADALPADSLLRGCSWVLAIPPDPSRSPTWFQVMSSWNWSSSAGRKRRLILRNQGDFELLTGAAASGSKATVFAFEGIVRVDEQVVTLN